MCSIDAGCDDAGEPDSGMMTPMDGAVPDEDGGADAGERDASVSDASVSDASVEDAGAFDAGPGSVAACSCETALNSEGSIHVCTGSFDRATCRGFSCELGTPRSERCPESQVRLCCTMDARRLYSHLYDDCEHSNCEAGFRAQCSDFGGQVTEGPCDAPEGPDDPDTEIGSICSVAAPGSSVPGAPLAWAWLLGLTLLHGMRRSRRS